MVAHLCCRVEIIGGLAGLLHKILSMSSLTWWVNLGTTWNRKAAVQYTCHNIACCLFWPANPCSACILLVEIIFFSILSSFFHHKRDKKRKSANITQKGVYQGLGAILKCWLTPKRWSTPGKMWLVSTDVQFVISSWFKAKSFLHRLVSLSSFFLFRWEVQHDSRIRWSNKKQLRRVEDFWSNSPINVGCCGNIYYIFGHVQR